MAAKQLILTDGGIQNDDMYEMAERELKIIVGLQDHKNIVQVYDYFIKKGVYWIFLEFCDLEHLKAYLRKNQSLGLLAKMKIMLQSASAVAFMHRQDPAIVHRDLKLENIMMKREGSEDVVKITDFGLSKLCEEGQSLSVAFHQGQFMTTTCGSQYFMAPEFSAEFEGGVKYDASVDTFALGLVCLVVLDGGSNKDLLPLSVEAKRSGRKVSIGEEMVAHHRGHHPCPTVVEAVVGDAPTVRRVKRVILHMTKFRPMQRKDIQEVEAEMSEMVDYLVTSTAAENMLAVVQREKDELLSKTIQQQFEIVENQQKEGELVSTIKALQNDINLLESELSGKNDKMSIVVEKLINATEQATLYKKTLEQRHKLDQTIKILIEDQQCHELKVTSKIQADQVGTKNVDVSSLQNSKTHGNRISKFRKVKTLTEKEKTKYLSEIEKMFGKPVLNDDNFSDEDEIPDLLRDQCKYMRTNPEYQLHGYYGNDAPFNVPPWFSKYPRKFADSRSFKTGLPEWSFFRTRSNWHSNSPVISPDQLFQQQIARYSRFSTKLERGEQAWQEMPLGVLKRDVCAPNQDPDYNQREPLTSDKMRKKRLFIARRLAKHHKQLRFKHVTVRHDCSSSSLYAKHVETWVETMQGNWMTFTELVQ